MFDVLPQIVIPLIISFLLGLEVGWLLWRWRRRPNRATELQHLRARAVAAEARLAALANGAQPS